MHYLVSLLIGITIPVFVQWAAYFRTARWYSSLQSKEHPTGTSFWTAFIVNVKQTPIVAMVYLGVFYSSIASFGISYITLGVCSISTVIYSLFFRKKTFFAHCIDKVLCICGVRRYVRWYYGIKWRVISYTLTRRICTGTFLAALVFTYWSLGRRYKKPAAKKHLEGIASELKEEGLGCKQFFELVSYSIKAGSMAAAFVDWGTLVSPKDYRVSSVIGDIALLISKVLPSTTKEEAHEGLGFDEVEYLFSAREFLREVQAIFLKHKGRIAFVALGSLCGMLVYLYINKRDAFMALIGRPQSFAETFETKRGKNKSPAGRKRQYVVYDQDDIVDFFKDGVPMAPIRGDLPRGHYEIGRADKFGNIIFEEFYVDDQYDDETPPYFRFEGMRSVLQRKMVNDMKDALEALKQRNATREETPRDEVMVPPSEVIPLAKKKKVVFPEFLESGSVTELKNNTCGCGKLKLVAHELCKECHDLLQKAKKTTVANKKKPEPKKEALVPSSVIFKTDHVRNMCAEVLDVNGEFLQNCISTQIGVVFNKHSAAAARFFRYQGKQFPLTKQIERTMPHHDLVLYERPDGFPAAKKAMFSGAHVGQKMAVLHCDGIATGEVKKLLVLQDGDEVEVTASTLPGWCGSPYIDSNGKIIAIHSRAGQTDRTNAGIAITEEFRKLFDPQTKNV